MKKNFLYVKNFHLSVVGFFLFFLSFLTFNYVTYFNNSAINRMTSVVNVIDNKLGSYHSTIDDLFNQNISDCGKSMIYFRKLRISNPDIQSINIIKDDAIVCSSYPYIIGYKNRIENDTNIDLLMSDFLVPNKFILIIKKTKNKYSIVISVRDLTFTNLVKLSEGDLNFNINTDKFRVNSNGVDISNKTPDSILVHSDLYPFSISTNIPIYVYTKNFLQDKLEVLVVLLFFMIVYLAFCFKFRNCINTTFLMGNGLLNNEFIPFAQPIVNEKGIISGFEVLIRWKRNNNIIYPSDFISIAEKNGMIIPITLSLFKSVYEMCVEYDSLIPKNTHLSINICPDHLSNSNSEGLIKVCKLFSVFNNINLVLEVTEGQVIEFDGIVEAVDTLKGYGVKFAMDDFGTGFSTIENIKKLKADIIKIDKQFIDLIKDENSETAFVDNIIDLSKRLGVSIIAEGVETKAQEKYLLENNVEYLQGYLYSKPIPLNNLLDSYY